MECWFVRVWWGRKKATSSWTADRFCNLCRVYRITPSAYIQQIVSRRCGRTRQHSWLIQMDTNCPELIGSPCTSIEMDTDCSLTATDCHQLSRSISPVSAATADSSDPTLLNFRARIRNAADSIALCFYIICLLALVLEILKVYSQRTCSATID